MSLERTSVTPLTCRKVPSSPREFFAKLYETSATSTDFGEVPRMQFATTLEPTPPEPIRDDVNSFWPSMAAAAAQLQLNFVYNLTTFNPAAERLVRTGSDTLPSDSSTIPDSSTISPFQIPPAFNNFLVRKRRRDGRVRRQRTTFSSNQTVSLEIEFQRTEYISRSRRCELAQRLALSETQIKIWFQNRRAKDKRLEKAQMDQQVLNLFNCYEASTYK